MSTPGCKGRDVDRIERLHEERAAVLDSDVHETRACHLVRGDVSSGDEGSLRAQGRDVLDEMFTLGEDVASSP